MKPERKLEAAPVEQPEEQRNTNTQISKITGPKCLTISTTAADSKLCKKPATRLKSPWEAAPDTREDNGKRGK